MSLFSDRAAEPQSKVAINLMYRQIALLDRLAVDMRSNLHFEVTRSDLIQAIIEASQLSGVDLADACSEREVTEMMLKVSRGMRKRRG